LINEKYWPFQIINNNRPQKSQSERHQQLESELIVVVVTTLTNHSGQTFNVLRNTRAVWLSSHATQRSKQREETRSPSKNSTRVQYNKPQQSCQSITTPHHTKLWISRISNAPSVSTTLSRRRESQSETSEFVQSMQNISQKRRHSKPKRLNKRSSRFIIKEKSKVFLLFFKSSVCVFFLFCVLQIIYNVPQSLFLKNVCLCCLIELFKIEV